MENIGVKMIAGLIKLVGLFFELFFSFLIFVVSYWYVFAAIGIIVWIVGLFTGSSYSSSNTNSNSNSLEGDYVVYDLGKEKPQVDRFHVRKF